MSAWHTAQVPATLVGKTGDFASLTRRMVDIKKQWQIAEDAAAQHGRTMDRNELRLVVPVHLAETRREAIEATREGAAAYLIDYLERTNGRQRSADVPPDQIVERMAEAGAWIVGTPDDAIATLDRLDELSGGYGGIMILAHEWAGREATLRSYGFLPRRTPG